MPKPTTTTLTLQDVQGQITSLRRFVTDVLGFDASHDCHLKVESDGNFSLYLSAEDKFQRKREYSERIGRLHIWEPGQDLEAIFAEAWRQLGVHMRRDERELRFGLAQLGDTLEGDQFTTEVGKMIYARMKAVRDEISAGFLPKFEQEEPVSGPTARDDVPGQELEP